MVAISGGVDDDRQIFGGEFEVFEFSTEVRVGQGVLEACFGRQGVQDDGGGSAAENGLKVNDKKNICLPSLIRICGVPKWQGRWKIRC